MDLGLAGRQVVITGASKGIGLAAAIKFAEDGASVVLVARDRDGLAAAAERVPGQVAIHPADLSDEAERHRLAEVHAGADILVNNAGAIPRGHLDAFSMAAWREAWELKVFGYIHLTQLFLRPMRRRRSGVIVNVIGTAGRAPRADYVCGGAANASLIAFTEAVGGETVDDGVRVVGVNPGPTATSRFLRAPVDGDGPDPSELAAAFPGVRLARPSAVADVIVYAASERASSLSGVVVDADQGMLRKGVTAGRGRSLDG